MGRRPIAEGDEVEDPPARGSRPWDRLLRHPWWLGIGGFAAVVGGIAAVLAIVLNGDGHAPRPSEDNDPSINGWCNSTGDQVDLDCSTRVIRQLPKQRGAAEAVMDPGSLQVFAGPPDELPTPPDYPSENINWHCPDWLDWISQTEDIYTVVPYMYVGLEGSQTDIVAITDVDVNVYSRSKLLKSYTKIRCNFQADAEPGVILTADTKTGHGTLSVLNLRTGNLSAPVEIPPTVFELKSGGVRTVDVRIESTPGYMYEGSIEITANINGKTEVVSFGSADNPLRWVTSKSHIFADIDLPGKEYDWNVERQEWGSNFPHVYPSQ